MNAFSSRFFAALDDEVAKFPLLELTRRPVFVAMLTLQEQVMRASETLLEFAAATDEYFARHLQDERGHGEWIRADLAALGVTAGSEPPMPEIVKMVGSQYYHLLHSRPFAFLGYLAFLEGYPAASANVQILKTLYPEAMRTIAFHAKSDIEHRRELIEILNRMPAVEWPGIVDNALQSAGLYKRALWRLLVKVEG